MRLAVKRCAWVYRPANTRFHLGPHSRRVTTLKYRAVNFILPDHRNYAGLDEKTATANLLDWRGSNPALGCHFFLGAYYALLD